MPHIYQIDPAWSELPYAGGTIRENACGPTCLTMVYIFKTGHTDKTPVDICALAEAGNYAPTGATEWSFMTSGAWQLGLNGTQLYNDRESITQALRSGAPVIAAVRPGTFTNVGHYIVLYGIDDANQIGVYDPNSASRSARRWGFVEVLNGKMHPGIWPKSGILFPKRTASGKRISPLSSKVGCAFRTGGSWQSGTTHLSLSPMSAQ